MYSLYTLHFWWSACVPRFQMIILCPSHFPKYIFSKSVYLFGYIFTLTNKASYYCLMYFVIENQLLRWLKMQTNWIGWVKMGYLTLPEIDWYFLEQNVLLPSYFFESMLLSHPHQNNKTKWKNIFPTFDHFGTASGFLKGRFWPILDILVTRYEHENLKMLKHWISWTSDFILEIQEFKDLLQYFVYISLLITNKITRTDICLYLQWDSF